MRGYPFLDHPGPIPLAHRGGARYGPNLGIENSMTAFENAVKLGYRYLETDVHATADGVLVAFHDATLDRVTDRHGLIAQMPFQEVRRARIGGREPIPLLADVLDAWPHVRVNIDPKADSAVEPLVRVIREAGAEDRVCISSFSQRRVRRIRKLLGPRVATGLGPVEIAALKLPLSATGHRWVLSDAPVLQVPSGYRGVNLLTPRLLDRAHELGRQVHVWTVDDPDRMHALLDLGVDGLITDRPDILRDVLCARGQWAT